MSLSKQQMAGIGSGCAFLVVAGILGYMLFDASSGRAKLEAGDEETGDPGLEEAKSTFMGYNRAPVFPSQGSIDSVKSNEASYAAWYAGARALAARGDYAEPASPEDNSAFKDRLKDEVDRMAKLPGGVNGRISGAECRFGFEKYLGESGILPDQKDVPLLARELASIGRAVDIFAEAGVFEVQSVVRPDPPKAVDREEKRPNGGAKKAKGGGEPGETCLEYKFALRARPVALVKMLNGLSADARFMVVKDFSFRKAETSDMILSNISAKESAESKAAEPSSGRRGRRGRSLEQQPAPGEAEAGKGKSRLVVDPELDAPFEVTFTLAVYDFGGAQAAEGGDKGAASTNESPASGEAAPRPLQGKEAK
ncbi:MAG: Amuc_1100 family pilus-like protein [Kiritimatiellae bacterium]|nr:Amuc_1100 family pilus-like protein [Kiritimatiellia bacterium]